MNALQETSHTKDRNSVNLNRVHGDRPKPNPGNRTAADGSPVDFNLHGFVRVRLLDATPQDVAVIARQLGPIQDEPTGQADITIRFVDRLEVGSPLRSIGLNDAAFSDDAFLVLKGKHHAQVRVQIPLDRVGQEGCTILCQRPLPAVPLLIALVNLVALGKGVLPLHASAFVYRGQGIMATGWAKGGKTETLLAFAERGAQYIGDEWIYLSPGGERMYGIPEPIRLWQWHLDEMPRYRSLISGQKRAQLRGLRLAVNALERGVVNGPVPSSAAKRLGVRVASVLKRQLNVQIPPRMLFGVDGLPSSHRLDKVLFVVSHDSDQVALEQASPEEIAQRMVFSLQEERTELLSYYRKFRFAFPERTNPLLEEAEAIQRELLGKALAGKECYQLVHPYPMSIPSLYDAVAPILEVSP